MWTERSLPLMPCAGSGSRPACFARISSQWPGMITKKTLPAIIVPIIEPTTMNIARGANSWPAA